MIIFVLIIAMLQIRCSENKDKRHIFEKQLGTYLLDIRKTRLGSYAKDSNLYKGLSITFNGDSTFIMNMKVPFIYDSCGTWIAGDGSPYNYNQLFYKSFKYNKNGSGEHFFPVSSADSVFLLNSTTPQKGNEIIEEIYFKKVQP